MFWFTCISRYFLWFWTNFSSPEIGEKWTKYNSCSIYGDLLDGFWRFWCRWKAKVASFQTAPSSSKSVRYKIDSWPCFDLIFSHFCKTCWKSTLLIRAGGQNGYKIPWHFFWSYLLTKNMRWKSNLAHERGQSLSNFVDAGTVEKLRTRAFQRC